LTSCVGTFLRGLTSFGKPYEETERKLKAAHEDVRDFVARVEMRYAGKTEHIPVAANWTPVCGGVRQVECYLPVSECTLLNVVFEPGAVIERHSHADHRETIFVVEGEIIDVENGVVTGTNGVYVIPPGRYHIIKSERGALLNVLFHPKIRPTHIDSSQRSVAQTQT
jgi:quercetin dioxygenase-like cupin family protein